MSRQMDKIIQKMIGYIFYTLQIKFSLVFSIDYVKLKEIKKEKQVRISSSVDLVFSFSVDCKRYKEDTNDETESKRAGKAHAAHGR